MALKDLIASKSALTEGAIEALIKDYVRYDVEEKEITLLPAATALSSKQKVLVYLVALQGWPIVTKGDDVPPTAAKPADIGDRVGIHGGTLRPLLKDLKDRHLIGWKSGAYLVRAASLADIKKEIDGKATAKKPARPRRAVKQPAAKQTGKAAKRKALSGRSGNLAEKFNSWIADGFFKEPRTLADVQTRFHEQGDIIPQTAVPRFLLTAVRAKPPRLTRKKADIGGKKVWVYKEPVRSR